MFSNLPNDLFRGLVGLAKAWYFILVLAGFTYGFSFTPYASMGPFSPAEIKECAVFLLNVGAVSFLLNGKLSVNRQVPVLGGLITLLTWVLSIIPFQLRIMGINLANVIKEHHLVAIFAISTFVSYVLVVLLVVKNNAKLVYVQDYDATGDEGTTLKERISLAFRKVFAAILLQDFVQEIPTAAISVKYSYMSGRTAGISRRRVENQKNEVVRYRRTAQQIALLKAQKAAKRSEMWYGMWFVGKTMSWGSFIFLIPMGYYIYKAAFVEVLIMICVIAIMLFAGYIAQIVGDTNKAARRRMFIGLSEVSLILYAVVLFVVLGLFVYEAWNVGKSFYYTQTAVMLNLYLLGGVLVAGAIILYSLCLMLAPPKNEKRSTQRA